MLLLRAQKHFSRGTIPLDAQHIIWPTTWLSTVVAPATPTALAAGSSKRCNDYRPARTEFKITETSIRKVRKREAYNEYKNCDADNWQITKYSVERIMVN